MPGTDAGQLPTWYAVLAQYRLRVPPHCVRPVCSGNTFPANMESFTPKLRVPTTRINFPACPVSDKAYQVGKERP
eukprot:2979169-Rhodomonas_salina.3